MQINAPKIPRLSSNELRDLDYDVMKQAFATQRVLGCRLADERVYQMDLLARLNALDWPRSTPEVAIRATHEEFTKEYSLDLIVAGRFVYELKAVPRLLPEHKQQLLKNLLLTNTAHGKLANFGSQRVVGSYVNAPAMPQDRYTLDVVRDDLAPEGQRLREILMALMEDWGLYLEAALYNQALIHFWGGEDHVLELRSLTRDGISIGDQRFHICGDQQAFVITRFENPARHASHLRPLLNLSPLKAMHWINLWQREVYLTTTLQRSSQTAKASLH